ncbi:MULTISPECIES: hypothetical protein [Actinosynnema]|uniref:hypothetical protein n=1 Tax=Actinosynnema TaxID=40566 RepID=UPI0020A2CA81|nr:hypothetical protein [Actinosynnema pretiosum]MCP2097396.1 hypothetical protein [Actinosynnema pretiosum]
MTARARRLLWALHTVPGLAPRELDLDLVTRLHGGTALQVERVLAELTVHRQLTAIAPGRWLLLPHRPHQPHAQRYRPAESVPAAVAERVDLLLGWYAGTAVTADRALNPNPWRLATGTHQDQGVGGPWRVDRARAWACGHLSALHVALDVAIARRHEDAPVLAETLWALAAQVRPQLAAEAAERALALPTITVPASWCVVFAARRAAALGAIALTPEQRRAAERAADHALDQAGAGAGGRVLALALTTRAALLARHERDPAALEPAVTALGQALGLLDPDRHRLDRAHAHRVLADVLTAQGEHQSAEEHLRAAVDQARDGGDLLWSGRLLLVQARHTHHAHGPQAALPLLHEAARTLTDRAATADQAGLHELLAAALDGLGEREAAAAHWAQAAHHWVLAREDRAALRAQAHVDRTATPSSPSCSASSAASPTLSGRTA